MNLLPLRAARQTAGTHLRRHGVAYVLGTALYACVHSHYRLAINAGDSLPHHLYLIELGQMPQHAGELLAFRWQARAFYRPGRLFIKRLAGLPGQHITVRERMVHIDGVPQGRAKPATRRGLAMQAIAPGTIPCGRYYVHASHPDSLDSRYAVTGLIAQDQIVGRAHALF